MSVLLSASCVPSAPLAEPDVALVNPLTSRTHEVYQDSETSSRTDWASNYCGGTVGEDGNTHYRHSSSSSSAAWASGVSAAADGGSPPRRTPEYDHIPTNGPRKSTLLKALFLTLVVVANIFMIASPQLSIIGKILIGSVTIITSGLLAMMIHKHRAS